VSELGEQHRLITRTGYAILRVSVTRNDQGQPTLNSSLLAGYASTIGLSNASFSGSRPQFQAERRELLRPARRAAFAFAIREFLDQALLDAQLRREE
jgi:hypothetical protein